MWETNSYYKMGHFSKHRIEVKYDTGIVEYTLTTREQIQLIMATVISKLTGFAPADYMRANLEELLCGYVPSRHKVVVSLSNDKLDNLPDIYAEMLTD